MSPPSQAVISHSVLRIALDQRHTLGEVRRSRRRHATRRLKLIRVPTAHAHARSQATNAMTKPEVSAKKRNHAATVQQIYVRSFQTPLPGLVSPIARARAIGARRIANDPKTRKVSLSRLSS